MTRSGRKLQGYFSWKQNFEFDRVEEDNAALNTNC